MQESYGVLSSVVYDTGEQLLDNYCMIFPLNISFMTNAVNMGKNT